MKRCSNALQPPMETFVKIAEFLNIDRELFVNDKVRNEERDSKSEVLLNAILMRGFQLLEQQASRFPCCHNEMILTNWELGKYVSHKLSSSE